ncbi:molybdenum cofactor guanylyltransferase [Zoogloea ramigera]|uniref:Molybdenum cofactor guanylyltransferase n=1 Tax=Zoogloea ramigera TaxID=350 RepID=A0A4Y4CRE8_ZOORA|nr:molybdenum cofactor guanylyltransferase MobA [Zoogloea ramigera]GEC95498.1 molybdenum cofactor guanylyltransferase [Zoogloea ramigera]
MIPPTPERITGLVLAGGLGRRMGGVDKGLSLLGGEPLVEHIIRRLAPQVGQLIINANQNHDIYAGFGYPVVGDRIEGHAGPLAGLEAGLAACTTPYLLTVPCDSPFLPADLVSRLAACLTAHKASIAVARTGEQLHPVFSLIRSDELPELQAFINAGGRRMEAWLRRLCWAPCPFDDCPEAFANINTPDELRAHQAGDTAR